MSFYLINRRLAGKELQRYKHQRREQHQQKQHYKLRQVSQLGRQSIRLHIDCGPGAFQRLAFILGEDVLASQPQLTKQHGSPACAASRTSLRPRAGRLYAERVPFP